MPYRVSHCCSFRCSDSLLHLLVLKVLCSCDISIQAGLDKIPLSNVKSLYYFVLYVYYSLPTDEKAVVFVALSFSVNVIKMFLSTFQPEHIKVFFVNISSECCTVSVSHRLTTRQW